MRFGLKHVGATEVWGELATQVQKTVTIWDEADYIGTVQVKWWDQNGKDHNPMSGFYIYISHNPNNN